jgi:exopolysaccharide production protein ExoQ
MLTLLNRFETGFTVFTVIYYSFVLCAPLGGTLNEVDPVNSMLTSEPEGNGALLLLMQFAILFVLLLLVALRWKRVLALAVQVPLCWALPLLAVFSTEWSAVPDVTLRRGIILLGATLLGVYWAARYPLATQLRLLGWGLGIAAILCFGFTLAVPSLGIEHGEHAGAWRGLFSQKNVLARVMVLSVLVHLSLVLNRERLQLLWWGGLLISTALLLLSTSKTALLILLVLLIAAFLFRSLRGRSLYVFIGWLLGLLILSCLVLIVLGNAELILTALGRDVTLTGRTGIWDVVVQKIAARPWLGYGYKGFWLGLNGDSGDVWYATFFMAPHAHNGYLDLLLDLGIAGFSLFSVSCLIAIGRAISWLRQQPSSMLGNYPLLFLTYLLLYNITESSLILEPNNLFWLLYVTVAASLHAQVPESAIDVYLLEESYRA